jgi:flagellar biogenesis protein FliO
MLNVRARNLAAMAGQPRLAGVGLFLLILLFTLAVGWLIVRGNALTVVGVIALSIFCMMILARWQRGLYGLSVYLPVAGLVTLALHPWEGPALLNPLLYKDWLFVLPAYFGFLAAVVMRRERFPRLPRLPLGLLLALSVLVIAQTANPHVPNLLVALIGTKVWLFYIPLYFLTAALLVSRRQLIFLLRLLLVVAIVPCVIGIAEFALGQLYGHLTVMESIYRTMAPEAQQGFAVYEVGGGLLPRGTPSTFTFVTQFFGYLLSMLVACYAVWRTDPSPRWRRLGHFMLMFVALNALLTGARSAFLFVPLLLFLAFGLDRGLGGLLRAVALAGGMLAGALLLLSVRAIGLFEHVSELFVVYAQGTAYELLVQALISAPFGNGTGTNTGPARYAIPDPTSYSALENYYAKAVYELGILGLLLILALFGALIWQGFRIRRQLQDPALRPYAAGLLAFFIAVALNSFKGWLVDLDPLNVYFWVFAGVLARLPAFDAEAAEVGAEPAEAGT